MEFGYIWPSGETRALRSFRQFSDKAVRDHWWRQLRGRVELHTSRRYQDHLSVEQELGSWWRSGQPGDEPDERFAGDEPGFI
jgi:hypothetical protein